MFFICFVFFDRDNDVSGPWGVGVPHVGNSTFINVQVAEIEFSPKPKKVHRQNVVTHLLKNVPLK
jgi:hypothetical protein